MKNVEKPSRTKLKNVFIWIFGVVLPVIALVVEISTRICASNLFDPLPTYFHVALYATIPAANFWVWRSLRTEEKVSPWVGRALGFAFGIVVAYTLIFLPLVPLSFIAILFLGLGFCSLSPLLGFFATLVSRSRLKTAGAPVVQFWLAAVLGIFMLLVADSPAAFTQVALKMATSPDPGTSAEAVRLLRVFSSNDELLRPCYYRQNQSNLLAFLLSTDGHITTSDARKVYYRVKGRPFNSVPRPERFQQGRGFGDDEFWWSDDWDAQQGGDVVGGQLRHLNLVSSRMDGSVDSDGALSYTEWTMVFRNDARRQREARMQVALPSGGVVSRLTLWVDGEEREAAFAGKSKTKAAYKRVVERRRDPVLVTTNGPDRVMVQCFPVPPNGGEMKIRFGITAPLNHEASAGLVFRLPRLLERNFGISSADTHAIWLEGKRKVSAEFEKLKLKKTPDGAFAIRGTLSNPELNSPKAIIHTERADNIEQAWAVDTRDPEKAVVVQTVVQEQIKSPGHIVVVVDGSRHMEGVASDIKVALSSLSKDLRSTLVLAGDQPLQITDLSEAEFVGGRDNVPALNLAWDLAEKSPGGVIVWIHGPHPILLESVETLLQRWERRPAGPELFTIQATNGPNRVIRALDGIRNVHAIIRTGSLQKDLARRFDQWAGKERAWKLERKKIPAASFERGPDQKETSLHLVRLWAFRQVQESYYSGDKERYAAALATAAKYQLVTPLSGAVVLESEEQYQEAGLKPVEPGSVPSIPEPETWILMIVAAFGLSWAGLIRRRRASST